MVKTSIKGAGLVLAAMAFSLAGAAPSMSADAPAVVRKVLLQQDVANMPGFSMAEVSVDIPVGGREGRHTHPGPLMVYVLQGTLSLDYEGKPQIDYKAGDVFYVEAGKIHEGINKTNTPIKAIATFYVKKGDPITTQVQ